MNTAAALPAPLRRHIERNLPTTRAPAQAVLMEQQGQIRMKPDASWLPFTAEQRIETTRVGFVWHARVKMAPLLTAVVEDAFEDGHGRLDAKVWGVIPVAHGRGVDIDQGEVQRYLAELPWNPAALLHNPQLQFEARGADEVRVWCGQPACYVDLRFDEAGDIAGTLTTTRRKDDAPYPWEGRFFDYVQMDGARVPSRGEVMWHLPDGPFSYWRGRMTGWRLAPPG